MASPSKRRCTLVPSTDISASPEHKMARLHNCIKSMHSIYESTWKPALTLLNTKPPQAIAAGILMKEANGKFYSTLNSSQYATNKKVAINT